MGIYSVQRSKAMLVQRDTKLALKRFGCSPACVKVVLVIGITILLYTSFRVKYSNVVDSSINDIQVQPPPGGERYTSLEDLLAGDFPENVKSLHQDDEILQKYVRLRHLTPPSKLPYNLPGSGNFANGHSQLVSDLFKHKRNGTFIEAGAYDGVAASNSIYFEKALGWRGLLAECNPHTVPTLKMKRRKAWIADVCLSTTEYPATLNFSNPTTWAPSARIGAPVDLSAWGVKTDWTHFEVQAIPLFTLLSAVNMTEIDFFSLDVEGAEFDVLKTIPFDRVSIKVIDMEVQFYAEKTKEEIHKFMESKGYRLLHSFEADRFYAHSSFQS